MELRHQVRGLLPVLWLAPFEMVQDAVLAVAPLSDTAHESVGAPAAPLSDDAGEVSCRATGGPVVLGAQPVGRGPALAALTRWPGIERASNAVIVFERAYYQAGVDLSYCFGAEARSCVGGCFKNDIALLTGEADEVD